MLALATQGDGTIDQADETDDGSQQGDADQAGPQPHDNHGHAKAGDGLEISAQRHHRSQQKDLKQAQSDTHWYTMRFTDRWERWRLTQQGVQKLVAAGLRQGSCLGIVLGTLWTGKGVITARVGVVGPAVAAVDIFCDGLDYGLRGVVI